MLEDFCELFLKRLKGVYEEEQVASADGTLKSYEEYKFVCGRLAGLRLAEGLLRDTYKDFC